MSLVPVQTPNPTPEEQNKHEANAPALKSGEQIFITDITSITIVFMFMCIVIIICSSSSGHNTTAYFNQ